jgi:hypothetical protein
MARRRSQKNKKTPPKENNEVTLEILLSDYSNYTSEEDQRCIRLNYLAFDILGNSLSKEDYHAFIIRYDEHIHDVHDIWTRIKSKFNVSKHISSYDTSTSFSPCETNPLKEEEENERWRPNDESTSPKGLSSHSNSHTCCVANENDSGSTNEDEEDERSFTQLYAHLSQEDKAVMLKLLKRAREQSEALHMLEDILSIKMQCFEELTKELSHPVLRGKAGCIAYVCQDLFPHIC